jgi:hypothetical protein
MKLTRNKQINLRISEKIKTDYKAEAETKFNTIHLHNNST